jgi:glycosyltransferase involved in cell wall biosynthesis
MRVCHLTSVHTRYDTRIFLKQCVSLHQNNFDVSLIVADGKGDEIKKGISILDVGVENNNRFYRFIATAKKVYKKALEIDADVYHFHDSELMIYGLLLSSKGKKVIYDIHEDLPRQLLTKPYLNPFLRKIASFFIEKLENYCASKFDFLFTATPFIRDRFLKFNLKTIDINNYPLLDELFDNIESRKKNQICFIGGISEIRGIEALVNACQNIKGKLVLAGKFGSSDLEQKIKSLKGWENVDYRGFVNRDQVKKIMSESKAGIVTFLAVPNHINSQPNKMFEYMSAGLPIICSNFDLWKSIVEESRCGHCVDPNSIEEISNLINNYFLDNSLSSQGTVARKLVEDRYNWAIEEKKMIRSYKLILNND